jgi:S1-C subfamily serine protease
MRLLTICATALWLTWSGAAAAQAPVAIEGVYHVVAWPRLDAAGAREWVDGTAVLIDAAQGYLLTAYPVLSGAGSIEILTGDGRRLAARLVGREGDTVAVLQVTGAGLPQPAWVDRPEIEDQTKAMVVGFSHEEGQTARPTTVTAKEYAQTDWLAFDASLPEAMLGAALIDGDGGLIGIVIRATGGAGRKADRALRIDDARAAMNRVVTRTPERGDASNSGK